MCMLAMNRPSILYNMPVSRVRYCTIQCTGVRTSTDRPIHRIYTLSMAEQTTEALFQQRHINTYTLTNTLERVALAHIQRRILTYTHAHIINHRLRNSNWYTYNWTRRVYRKERERYILVHTHRSTHAHAHTTKADIIHKKLYSASSSFFSLVMFFHSDNFIHIELCLKSIRHEN